jgi:hypothetical protein
MGFKPIFGRKEIERKQSRIMEDISPIFKNGYYQKAVVWNTSLVMTFNNISNIYNPKAIKLPL